MHNCVTFVMHTSLVPGTGNQANCDTYTISQWDVNHVGQTYCMLVIALLHCQLAIQTTVSLPEQTASVSDLYSL